ncbi:hypothetical protein [Microbacterium sp. Se63.02b]|uniref:hypothetical protein n=1 Tax=Microbacterium sp. Se63.02b TaxID=2709304 RepID=UPI001604E4C8|nr:hypothetical protein [Microbacterium sp. Se63.02b]QNA94001.1 hypothetical protein G4G29_20210 [Microbacterium sp. Se63.02b]
MISRPPLCTIRARVVPLGSPLVRCSVIFERKTVVARENVSRPPAFPISTASGRTTMRMLRNQKNPANTATVSATATISTTRPRVAMFIPGEERREQEQRRRREDGGEHDRPDGGADGMAAEDPLSGHGFGLIQH